MGSAPIPGNHRYDRYRIEQALLQEVEQARAAYREVKALSARDFGLSHADGHAPLGKANVIQSAASERYEKALKALTDFMLHKLRKLPPLL
jgi:hypothetical protein